MGNREKGSKGVNLKIAIGSLISTVPSPRERERAREREGER